MKNLSYARCLPAFGFLAAQSLAFTPALAAPQKLAAQPSDHLAVSVVLTDGERAVRRTRRDLGITMAPGKGPVVFQVDAARLKAALRSIETAFHVESSGARPFLYKGKIGVKAGSEARALNIPTTAERIMQEVVSDPSKTTFTVALEKHPSPLTPEKLKGITGILGRMTTRTSANPKRNHNVSLAVSEIDGTLLSPGESFSLNATVGKRTQTNGFRTAPVFINAELKPGIGGGVSQVTGTLFNAAAKSGLKILEVHPHSRPVAYLPLGYDATVVWGDEDLKFKNDTAAPVLIEYRFDLKTRELTALLWGAPVKGKTVRLSAQVQHLAPGKIDAQLWRVIKKDGKIAAKERLFTHHYRWDPSKKE